MHQLGKKLGWLFVCPVLNVQLYSLYSLGAECTTEAQLEVTRTSSERESWSHTTQQLPAGQCSLWHRHTAATVSLWHTVHTVTDVTDGRVQQWQTFSTRYVTTPISVSSDDVFACVADWKNVSVIVREDQIEKRERGVVCNCWLY